MPPLAMGDASDKNSNPRPLGWFGTAAMAMGGSNVSLSLITALFVGQDVISGQGSAAVPLLIVGFLISCCAAPGWVELVLMSPNRVGGIAAACSAAFKPYSPLLSALAGVSYWWGWVPVCGLSAMVLASVIHQWCIPDVPTLAIACTLVIGCTLINLLDVGKVAALAIPCAVASATLAFISMVAPLLGNTIDWKRAVDFRLSVPFPGVFGGWTSLMAGLYLVGFGAPAFEAALCHVGETRDPARNVPRAMLASGVMAGVFFVGLPLVWLGALGPEALGRDLIDVLGPTFAPLFGSLAKAAAIGFIAFNLFHGALQPLAGASRTLVQLSEDGLAPRFLSWRLRHSAAPWAAILLTSSFALLFMLIGNPIWLIASANFTYLIGIGLPSVAVWLLRRNAPEATRPYRAPKGMIVLGLGAAGVWIASAVFGYEQFGMKAVLIGITMAYSGAAFYAWRKLEDRRERGLPWMGSGLHTRLTGAMMLVLALDAAGYMLAIEALPRTHAAFITALEDIFVAVAFLTISVGIVIPGMIVQTIDEQERLAVELLHAKETAEYKAFHDALTGLANRHLFVAELDAALARRRAGREQAAVLFIDLDRFKIINDSLGHAAGDALIVGVASRLLATVGGEKTEGGNLVARLGGDEFAVLLRNIAGADCAKAMAARIQEALAPAFVVFDQNVHTGASIGIALIASGDATPADVLRDADLAMYRAKDLGRGRAEIYQSSLHAEASARLMLETDLRRALKDNEFVLHYQPIVLLRHGTIVGFEALVRWRSPERGLVSPGDFIPLAEETGLIVPLGMWVLREACKQAVIWQQEISKRSLQISVNVSPRQFANENLVDQIKDVILETGIKPGTLKLEITESSMMDDPDRAIRVLSQLRALGLLLAIDDFGTGYSSLSCLQRLPVDILKVDRCFVAGVLHDEDSRQIVTTIMALALGLGMDVVAEGIETEDQAAELVRLNCRYGQGYLFSQPIPAAETLALFSEPPRRLRSNAVAA